MDKEGIVSNVSELVEKFNSEWTRATLGPTRRRKIPAFKKIERSSTTVKRPVVEVVEKQVE